MTISELARRAGVKVSTVRFYERRGVLPPPERSGNGYRTYSPQDVARVRFLRRGQELGFTLAELAELAALAGGGRHDVVAAEVQEVGTAKLAEIDARLDDLRRVRTALQELLDDPCAGPRTPCPVVAALAGDAAVPVG
ncbi:MerR family transcriptional regulator [Isoptericola aurantiacus]|uniref:MerR family transcriptional regulator n=1 Tax=Isoptericola aurantiacus TaxID=3377839 RepID=UPI003839D6B6